MVVHTYGGHGHRQGQHHRSKPTASDRVEPKQLGRVVLDLEAGADTRALTRTESETQLIVMNLWTRRLLSIEHTNLAAN
jgi:hypothetical protein